MTKTEKIPIFFVLLNTINFEVLLQCLDFEKAEVMGVLTDDADLQIELPDGREVIVGSFAVSC